MLRENQNNATRIIAEDLDRLIFNEQVHSADEFQAVSVADEDLGAFIAANSGAKVALIGGSTVTTIVRPRTRYNLQGQPIGNTANPITVTYDGSEIEEYQPGDSLAVDNYYVLDYDIGEIYIVNESGDLQDPAGIAWTISYSKATNISYFDTDLPADTKAKEHWDSFLRLYALRKSLIEDARYYFANFGLMSGNTMVEIEQAEKFGANHRVPATELSETGNLGLIKNIPNYKTSAPDLWMGDRRVIIGQKAVTRLRITKPWQMGRLENQRDANNRFTGRKAAYGDQFVVLHTPTQLKAALTSIVLYSASERIARATP